MNGKRQKKQKRGGLIFATGEDSRKALVMEEDLLKDLIMELWLPARTEASATVLYLPPILIVFFILFWLVLESAVSLAMATANWRVILPARCIQGAV